MKRNKKILILVVVLVLLTAATLALTLHETKQEQIRASGQVILEIPADRVTAVSWESMAKESLAFHKEEGRWIYSADPTFPVNEAKIASLLQHFEAYSASFVIEDVTNYAQYNLTKPKFTLNIETADGSYQLNLGGFSTMDSQCYVDIGDGNVYMVVESPEEYVPSTLAGMITHDDTPEFTMVAKVAVFGKEDYTITASADSTGAISYMGHRNGQKIAIDEGKLEDYLEDVTNLRLVDYASYNASDEDLKAYGLDQPFLSVSIDYVSAEGAVSACTFHLGEVTTQATETEAATVSRYVRIGDSRIVYILSDYDYERLSLISPSDLRDTRIFPTDFSSVTGMEILLEGKTHSLTFTPAAAEGEEGYWSYGQTPVSADSIRSSLEVLEAAAFTDEVPGDRKEELSLTLHLSTEEALTLQFYRYDGSVCLVVMDGTPMCFVSRIYAIALVEAFQSIVLG